jgi:flagella basal body P-ring formation protein FlgA
MNSVRSRFNTQKFILHGICIFLVPISTCFAEGEIHKQNPKLDTVAIEKPIKEALEHKVSKLLLEQWHALGQRDDSTSNVLIKGIPNGYHAPGNCSDALEVVASKQLRPGDNSIEVSCMLRRGWSLMLNADIEVWRDVVVLRDHISRGKKITASSLVLQQRNIADLQRGYFTSFEQVTNTVSKRSLRAGSAINPTMVDLPIVIKRGQSITLRADRTGFSVDMKGEALKKGREGDKIKVKNSSTGKVLHGTIISPDLVLVD